MERVLRLMRLEVLAALNVKITVLLTVMPTFWSDLLTRYHITRCHPMGP
jgi:hypothetical protein